MNIALTCKKDLLVIHIIENSSIPLIDDQQTFFHQTRPASQAPKVTVKIKEKTLNVSKQLILKSQKHKNT